MIYGNKTAKQVIDNISDSIKKRKIQSWFFIIVWPKNIWKKTLINKLIKEVWTQKQDILMIQDPWKFDWKNYPIKVDQEQEIIKLWEKKYLTMWARQISDYMSKTPVWDHKIIFIENIERMNINASNAMLKNLEEPPKNTFIFASTSNKNKLLDTIVSRWTLIHMSELLKEDFKSFFDEQMISLKESQFNVLYAVSWWRIWLAKRLLEENNDLLEKIEEFVELEYSNKEKFYRFNIMKELINSWKINLFLDGLIFYYTHTDEFSKVQKLIDIKNKNQANVNLENLLFEYLLD